MRGDVAMDIVEKDRERYRKMSGETSNATTVL
jgi:hypothetical protein